ncbi:GGDEF domain-containing protein [Inhella proteolytica]|uniref:diguanylate cyclase n=1 Tax=Inhella proteolytica TaxID=2795029 RepID=A0A931J666_9BURK|nr:GGDEF domain-containing protein [Inhella proteolytica]MBH9576900.1 GGDEF domain-containing protein [Inhella proteolytica]
MQLHLQTVLLFAALTTAGVTVGIGLLAWRDRSAYLRDWAAALVAVCLGLALYGLREGLAAWLGVIVANLLLLSNQVFSWTGYARLFGVRRPWPWILAGYLAVAGVYVLLTYVWDSYTLRVLFFNALLCLLSAASALLLWDHRRRVGAAVLALPLGVHLLQVFLGLLRIGVTLHEGGVSQQSIYVSQGQIFVIMLNSLGVMAMAFGFMSLHAGRLLDVLETQAATDPLTGLLNRRGFDAALQREWRRHQRLGQGLALLMVDIDHFKQINDSQGHPIGDAALCHLAATLRQQLRPYDLIGRLGGEEFCVVLPGVSLELARQTAERLRRAPLGFVPEGEAAPVQMTVSIGVASGTPEDAGPEALLARADRALYQAKQQGRDRVVLSEPTA